MSANVRGIEGEIRQLTPGEVGFVIKVCRTSMGLKREALALSARVTDKTIQRAEAGERVCEKSSRRIACALGLPSDTFTKQRLDRYGHQAGDVALQRAAKAVQAQIHRPLDVLSRYGGEEFAVLLYDTDGPHACDIAERMRLAVSALSMEHRGARAARVVTIGIAAIQPMADRAPFGALQLADEALYTAKVRGRNNVHLAAESDYSDLETGVFAKQSFAN